MQPEPDFDFGGGVVWRPDPETIRNSRLQAFLDRYGLPDPAELHRRSVAEPEWFWNAVLEELDIRPGHSRVMDTSAGVAWTRWCVGGRLNVAHECVHKPAAGAHADRPAVIWEGEAGQTRTWTYAELSAEVRRAAAGLRSLGVAKGDVVGLLVPMVPETAAALLACAHVGAIALPLFSGYGEAAVAGRLNDAGAKVLVTADGFPRRGRTVALKAVADAAAAMVPTLRHLVVIRRSGHDVAMTPGRDVSWDELPATAPGSGDPEPTDPEDPLLLIYTSGTTGRPKGAVHTHCGFPVKAAQDMAHGLDLHADERLFWVTDLGWMMGPWLIYGTLLNRAAMFLYDGAPDHPGPDRLWAMAAAHRLTALGISPTLVRALSAHGPEHPARHDLSALRKFGSTGEPWTPEAWMWLFETVGRRRLPILNYSGGTEISGGIVMGNVLSPLKPCSFSGPLPGMDADVVDEQGNSVRGRVGELVIRSPWIGMTRGFWNDPQRYVETYWTARPGVWTHGDWAAVDADGLWYILGRSDDTIKVAGKRLGPAEVEAILSAHPDVKESAAIGVPDPLKGQALVCFVVLKPGRSPSGALREDLRERVAAELGKPLKPAAVRFAADLPKTRNAKVMRRVVRAAHLGTDPGDLGALENPAAVEAVRQAE
jgi:acetyl-CoA synthetase